MDSSVSREPGRGGRRESRAPPRGTGIKGRGLLRPCPGQVTVPLAFRLLFFLCCLFMLLFDLSEVKLFHVTKLLVELGVGVGGEGKGSQGPKL